jgi:outer membrane immunogenic protein
MRLTIVAIVFLIAAWCGGLAAQTADRTATGLDLALTYSPERGKIADATCDCFWLQGAGANAAYSFYRGFGIAASLTGQHASNLTGGSDLGKVDYLFGPRYTFNAVRGKAEAKFGSRVYGEALFGGVHGFDGTFPAAVQAATSANAFAYQLGIGWDVALVRGFGLRPVEVSFYHSGLPNAASGTQDNLRLAFGVSYHWARH